MITKLFVVCGLFVLILLIVLSEAQKKPGGKLQNVIVAPCQPGYVQVGSKCVEKWVRVFLVY